MIIKLLRISAGMQRIIVFFVGFLLCSTSFSFGRTIDVVHLRTEYLDNPIGIDNPTPRFTWHLSDSAPGCVQKTYRIAVGTDSSDVAHGKGNVWESGEVSSPSNLVIYGGKELQAFTKYYWSVCATTYDGGKTGYVVADFEMGMMSIKNWKGFWISDNEDIHKKEAPYFRKTFSLRRRVVSARAYIAVAGLYELYVNGQKIGDRCLDPMYTRFDRRNLYVTYDITGVLREGGNAVGVLLGNGWYNFQSMAVWNYERAPWRNRPAFCMDIRIKYDDGSTELVVTDKTWKTSFGPVVFNSIYTGEHYDARKEQSGWDTVNFDERKWQSVIYRSAPSQNIVAEAMQPIRKAEKLFPISMVQKNDSTYIYDMGRNIAGITNLNIEGDSTTVVRVIHAERLDKNGFADQSDVDYFLADSTRRYDPFGTDIYHLSGKGQETFEPHFNYKGFRYVEVVGNKPLLLTRKSVVAYFMHSDVPPVGSVHTSNKLINQLYAATNASYLSNLFGYPTDCPQREKNGWTGDAHIASETGLYNFDAITVYEKWLADMSDEQQPNGVLPSIVPTSGWGYEWGNGLDWTSAVAIIPWNVYLFYGDKKILKDNYDMIRRYVDHVTDLYPSGLTNWGLGDWAPVKTQTPVELTSSIYYYVDVNILSKISRILNKPEEAEKYAALAKKIKDAVNAKYLDSKKALYGDGHQTEESVPLYWGIVPDSLKRKVAANLADSVALRNFHVDVGILGAKAILGALSDNGQSDIAYRLATQNTFPSWGYWIKNGATTLYESWEVNGKEESLNHIMFGEIGAWFFKTLGGIKPDENKPGFKNVILNPYFVAGLDSCRVEHEGPYGKIVSSWRRKGSSIRYQVTIPANSTASIYFGELKGKRIYEKDRMAKLPMSYQLPAGIYEFVIK